MNIPLIISKGGFIMKVVLLRHAETTFNNSGRFCGRIDCDITDNGKIITAKLASMEPFASGFTAMYVSPLKRTVQTLMAIYPNCRYIVDERLIEISLGKWEGIEKMSINQDDRKAFIRGLYTPPEALENHSDVVNRIISFFVELENFYNNRDVILVVTHNGVIRTIKQLLKMSVEKTKNSDFIIIDSKNLLRV